MSALKGIRQGVATLLTEAGIRAVAYVPSNPSPPIAFVVPGSPYLEPADAFGERVIRLDVHLVIGSASTDNASLSEALDSRVEAAAEALADGPWFVDDVLVQRWSPQDNGGPIYLVAVIGIRGDFTITDL